MLELAAILAVSSGLAGLAVPLARRRTDLAKGCLDLLLGYVILLLSLPLLAACAVIVKLSSKGPVFYWQTRVGQGGRPFAMCKLRTMRVGAEAGLGAVWASDRDARVIPACRWRPAGWCRGGWSLRCTA